MAFPNRRVATANITGSALAAHLIIGEVMGGTPNGILNTFTTASNVTGQSIDIYRQGIKQILGTDYTFAANGNTAVFQPGSIPQTGDIIDCDYIK